MQIKNPDAHRKKQKQQQNQIKHQNQTTKPNTSNQNKQPMHRGDGETGE